MPEVLQHNPEARHDEMGFQDIYDRPVVKEELTSELVKRLAETGSSNGKEFADSLERDLLKVSEADLAKVLGEDVIESLHGVLDPIHRDQFDSDEAFQDAVSTAVLEFMKAEVPYDVFEKRQRHTFREQHHFRQLSEVLSFGAYEKMVHIHLAPARTMTPEQLMTSVTDGLKELAKRMEEDPELQEIQEVTGTSWIVAKRPEMLEVLGFTIDGPISDEIREQHFPNDKGPISKASMSREAFLTRYGS